MVKRIGLTVVQPLDPDKARQSTRISEHPTAAEAFAAIDKFAAQAVRTGAPSDAIELIILDAADVIVRSDLN